VLANQPVLPLLQVNYNQMPPTKYITSPALVRDDVLDHNGGYYRGYNPYGTYNNGGPSRSTPTTIYRPPSGTVAPTTAPPSTAPPQTIPPSTAPATSPPTQPSPPTTVKSG
jgi:hypothetical protein